MATRRETQLRRVQLRQNLLDSCRDGSLVPGDVLPPLPELARQSGLSITLTSQVIKQLVDEGLLYTLQGAGTFVSRPQQGKSGVFLLIGPENFHSNTKQMLPMKMGFEERITQIGGTTLTLTHEQVAGFLAQSPSLAIEGVFNFQQDLDPTQPLTPVLPGVPQIFLGRKSDFEHQVVGDGEIATAHDWISFDHVDGGYQATRHLLNLRHQRIAFMGLHGEADGSHVFRWSRERQQGWQRALMEQGYATSGLIFNPAQSRVLSIDEQIVAAREVAQRMVPLVRQAQISAVVAVNCHAARGFFEALSAAGVPHSEWPAIICFGAAESTGDALAVMTEMRMPWEILGREAANLLWSRRNYNGEPRQVLVTLRLISRLSCKAHWPMFPESVTLALQHI